MKSKIIALTLLASANAYAVVVTVDSGGFTQAVVNSANTPIPVGGGWVGVGFFSTYSAGTDFSQLSGADLAADFVLFGPSFAFGGTGFDGFFSGVVDGGRVGASSPFLGQNLFTVTGNASTLADSSEALIYRHSVTFPNDDGAPAPASLSAVPGDAGGAYLFGGPSGGTTVILGTDIPAVMMGTLIPEPSVALLGAFGVLGLLRRRR